jgi:KEOPS complex subunit Pcc1
VVDESDIDDAPHQLSLRFEYDTVRRAEVVERSVRVEVGDIDDARSAAAVDRVRRDDDTADGPAAAADRDTVRVRIGAADLVALRAGANTWTRLLTVAESVAAAADR